MIKMTSRWWRWLRWQDDDDDDDDDDIISWVVS